MEIVKYINILFTFIVIFKSVKELIKKQTNIVSITKLQ